AGVHARLRRAVRAPRRGRRGRRDRARAGTHARGRPATRGPRPSLARDGDPRAVARTLPRRLPLPVLRAPLGAVERRLLAAVSLDALPEGAALGGRLGRARLSGTRLLRTRRLGALHLAALVAHLDIARGVVARRRVAEVLLRRLLGGEAL